MGLSPCAGERLTEEKPLTEPDNLPATAPGDEPVQSFIVRIWLEHSGEDQEPQWRGSVQHVRSGEKRYVDDMEEIVAFLTSHVGAIGVAGARRPCSWWRRLRQL